LQLLLQGQWGALGEAALGAVLAGGFAFLSIDVFLRMTRKVSLLPFVLYRLALGGAILWLL
jgi:undecaprenyl-diphosphatase